MKKIILHACCAPCAGYPIVKLAQDGYEPIVYFYNPNIYPFKEYEIRRNELREYCEKLNIPYFEGEYDIKEYYKVIKGLENEPEKGKRCEKCFELRLLKTAQFAISQGVKLFTTTLTISPHKNSNQIFQIAKFIQDKTNVEFKEFNFKKQDGFKISRAMAKENNMYAQSYCGCQFSIKKD